LPSGEEISVVRRQFSGGEGPRVALLAALWGDTPEGTRVLHNVGRHLAQHVDSLVGTVDIFPCVNPLAAHHGKRNWPGMDVDLNERFPGRADGHAPDRVAAALLDAVGTADCVVELRGGHPAFRQACQARVQAEQTVARERAAACNVRMVWARAAPPEPGSLADSLPSLICLEGGVGHRLTENVGLELSDGVLNLLALLGVLPEDKLPFHWAAIQRPVLADDETVLDIRANRGGLFLPTSEVWAELAEGAALGEIVDPLTGELRETLYAQHAARVVAQREQPVVYPGNLLLRIVAI
jgi:predicted deacylase